MSHKIPTTAEILEVSEIRSKEDRELIERAYAFAKEAHEGQKRYSGAPYFQHVATVALYIAEIGLDAQAISAGLLHDTVEDTGVTSEELEQEFGSEVARLVESVTKLGDVRYRGLDRHAESLRKLFAATASDVRVLIIKLMDRLHNARTLDYVPEHKRERIAKETLEIYSPIAFRLGMGALQKDLEDAAFPHAFPQEYARVQELMKERKRENERRLERAEIDLKRALGEAGIRNFRTQARVKGVYSLFKKLERKEWDISQIHDVVALRVILGSTEDCYRVFGVVHKIWTPLPGRIKDYISNPKLNGYQSIHTTVHAGDGGLIEVQIRTEEMNREALYGYAAHMDYKSRQNKEGGSSKLNWIWQFFSKKPAIEDHREYAPRHYHGDHAPEADTPHWVKLLAEAKEVVGDEEYYKDLREDFFSHRIFAFTPRGDVIDLPKGATPIDFAYAIHSDVGNHVASAKINGKLCALSTEIESGDVVEIESKQSARPSRKWLEYTKTNLAKRKIRAYLGEQRKPIKQK